MWPPSRWPAPVSSSSPRVAAGPPGVAGAPGTRAPPQRAGPSPTSRARTTATSSARSSPSGTPRTRTRRSRSRSSPTRPTSSTTTWCSTSRPRTRTTTSSTVDVVWTAEFAAKGWLQPLKGQFALDTTQLLPATVKAATYNSTLYARPAVSDGGMLYYRKDLVQDAAEDVGRDDGGLPDRQANGIGCYAGQFAKYEGLTVNAAEAINTAGGQIVESDGKTPTVDIPRGEARACSGLVDAYKNGDIPQGGDHLPGGAGPAGVRGRQAAVPAQLALRLQPGQDRRQLQGQEHVRRRAAARRRQRPRCLEPRRSQRGDQRRTPSTRRPRWTS